MSSDCTADPPGELMLNSTARNFFGPNASSIALWADAMFSVLVLLEKPPVEAAVNAKKRNQKIMHGRKAFSICTDRQTPTIVKSGREMFSRYPNFMNVPTRQVKKKKSFLLSSYPPIIPCKRRTVTYGLPRSLNQPAFTDEVEKEPLFAMATCFGMAMSMRFIMVVIFRSLKQEGKQNFHSELYVKAEHTLFLYYKFS